MKIISVTPFDDSIQFIVDTKVPVYKADADGAMQQTEDNVFSMSDKALARQVYPLNADIAELRSLRGQHLAGTDWIKLLTGATISMDSVFVKAGDKADDYTYENTGYVRTIKKLTLAESVAARLDRALGF